MVYEHCSLDDSSILNLIRVIDASYLLLHLRSIQDYIHVCRQLKAAAPTMPLFSAIPAMTSPTALPITPDVLGAREVCFEWLKANLSRDAPARHFRQKHLFILGPSETGKSSLFQLLDGVVRFYRFAKENYFCKFGEGLYDCALFDELQPGFGGIDMSTLHEFMDGGSVELRVKTQRSVTKRKNMPCIFASNYTLEELFPTNVTQRVAFRTRVTIAHFFNDQRQVFFDPDHPWLELQGSSSSGTT